MKKAGWKKKIKQATEEAGTYKSFFDFVIDTLADTLERRDEALTVFKQSGSSILVKHTNKSGATNLEQNPVLRMVNDLNRDALTYWRELGLTPAGLKRLNEKAMNIEDDKPTGLVAALIAISGESEDDTEDIIDGEEVLKTLE